MNRLFPNKEILNSATCIPTKVETSVTTTKIVVIVILGAGVGLEEGNFVKGKCVLCERESFE